MEGAHARSFVGVGPRVFTSLHATSAETWMSEENSLWIPPLYTQLPLNTNSIKEIW